MDLWPADLTSNIQRAPVQLLKEQGSKLAELTKGFVEGKVISYKRGADYEQLRQAFVLVAPALGGYRVGLFDLFSPPDFLYPVELQGEFRGTDGVLRVSRMTAKNEDEFAVVLRTVFANPKTVEVIRTLISRSDGLELPLNEDVPF